TSTATRWAGAKAMSTPPDSTPDFDRDIRRSSPSFPRMILILEDNEHRRRQFRAAAAGIAPEVVVRIWDDAGEMMNDLVEWLEHASLISLDHDLVRRPGAMV